MSLSCNALPILETRERDYCERLPRETDKRDYQEKLMRETTKKLLRG